VWFLTVICIHLVITDWSLGSTIHKVKIPNFNKK
jgi:hypothetical protein